MRKPRKNAWCSMHESITAEIVLFGIRRTMTLAASAIAALFGIPWERVKKRRQRGWSWNEALGIALRSSNRSACNRPLSF